MLHLHLTECVSGAAIASGVGGMEIWSVLALLGAAGAVMCALLGVAGACMCACILMASSS